MDHFSSGASIAKSTFRPGPAPKSATIVIEPAGTGIKNSVDRVFLVTRTVSSLVPLILAVGMTGAQTPTLQQIAIRGVSVLQRPFWNGDPEELRELFALAKHDRAQARCALWTHQFGWELRLTVNGSLVRSQVSRVCAEVLDAAEAWQRAMRAEGWQLPADGRRRGAVCGCR